MSNKEKYRLLCKKDKSIPIFMQDWWLDIVCEEAWDVCLFEDDNEILASMPFYKKKYYGFYYIHMPFLTQHLGPWIKATKSNYFKTTTQQKKIMNFLIEQLPKYDLFSQNWHYAQTNWLPFYWKGFEASTFYTYVIEDLTLLDTVWSNISDNTKRQIKRAKKNNILVKDNLSIDEMIQLIIMTYDRQGVKMPFNYSLIYKLIKEAKLRNQCKFFIGQDNLNINHAGVLIIWDEQSAYYLIGGANPELRESAAMSLCMWEAIKFSSKITKKFDFEGSMIEGIERFFRGFGAIQKPYFHLRHEPTKSLKIIKFIKQIFKT